ncbi:MAG TPA: rhodanese-like domain-containing protein, partial [Thermomicrobiales bacterium]|nr:rhodanese-like domain-containing protein [Thermomicrobiales bacterium]
TTIGREKRENYAFQPETADEFKEAVMGGMPSAPTYYPELKKVNKAGAGPITQLPAGEELDPGTVAARQAEGAMIVDAREKGEVAKGYIPGSVFAGADNNMTTWMGWLAPYEGDIVLIVDGREEYEQARLMLQRIGLDRVAGYLIGVEGWKQSGRELDTIGEVTVEQVSEVVGTPGAPIILDVRSDSEYEEGHIPGAKHHYAGEITQGDMPNLPKDADIVVVCGSGYRSMVASTLMKDAGFQKLASMVGGMEAWNEAKEEVTA